MYAITIYGVDKGDQEAFPPALLCSTLVPSKAEAKAILKLIADGLLKIGNRFHGYSHVTYEITHEEDAEGEIGRVDV